MTPEALDLSAQLRDELDASDRERMDDELREELETGDRRTFVADTRTIPARFSHLFAMAMSPAHCRAAMQNDRDRDSLAMRLGAGVHALAFGKPVIPYAGRRVKGIKKPSEWDKFRELHADKEILTAKEYAKAKHISAALLSHELAAPLLFGPDVRCEDTILWTQQGRKRRSTPDVWCSGATSWVAELKTTKCAAPWKFTRDAMYRAYHAQVADQCLAVEHATGKRPDRAYLIAVESVAPYAITVFELSPRALERGEMMCRAWLERLLLSEATGQWPPYSLAIESFDVPDDELAIDFGTEDVTSTPFDGAGA